MKNNNNRIIRDITHRCLRSDRRRNFFIITAIALTTFMIATVFSIALSLFSTFKQQQISLMGTVAHAAITKPTPAQLETLNTLDYITSIGTGNFVASVDTHIELNDIRLALFYFDETEWLHMRKPAYEDVVGSYPQAENEIMMPRWVLERMGITEPSLGMPILGMEIPLSYSINQDNQITPYSDTFILTGYFTSYMHIRSGNNDSLLVSKAFSDKYNKTPETDGSATVQFKDASKVLTYCSQLETDLGITDKQDVRPVPMYNLNVSDRIAMIVGVSMVALLLMLTGYLLIYNVMYTSVSRDIRFYGMLKTIGTTPKQLRLVVLGQIVRLCLIGLPIGVLLAVPISLIIVPAIVGTINIDVSPRISFSPLIYACAVLLSLVTAFIGAAKPARKAASVSPIEALRFTGIEIKKPRLHGRAYAKPQRMALRNIFRDRKRAYLVLVGLFISITTFITVSTIVLGMNTDNFVNSYMQSDFELINNTSVFVTADSKHKFTPDILNKIKAIPGIKDTETVTKAILYLTYTDHFDKHTNEHLENNTVNAEELEKLKKNFATVVIGIEPSALQELNETENTAYDIEAFVRGEYVLIAANTPELYGDLNQVELRASDTTERTTIPVGGFAPLYFRNSTRTLAPSIICSSNLLERLINDEPIITNVSVNVESGFDKQVLEALKLLTDGDYEFGRSSRIEYREELKQVKIIMFALGGGIAFILGFIGIMNFVNIMSVGIMTRKRELSVLEGVGMSKLQMRDMLVWEGLWYAIITLLLTGTLGNLIAYGLFSLFKQEATYAIFTYPTMPVFIICLIVFAICIIAPRAAYKNINSLPLSERLREAE